MLTYVNICYECSYVDHMLDLTTYVVHMVGGGGHKTYGIIMTCTGHNKCYHMLDRYICQHYIVPGVLH
jgi:hypothetical protein